MSKEHFRNGPTRYELFVTVSLMGIICYFVYALLAGADAFDWLCMNNSGGFVFGDYFQHLLFMQDAKHVYVNVQGVWGSFPPLIYIFYNFLFHLTHRGGEMYSDYYYLMNAEYVLLVFLFYSILITLGFLYAVKSWKKQSHYRMMFLCLIFSVPFFTGSYERGNCCMVVLILLLIALNWRESESKIKRELALVLIAASAGIKLYPAIFGLLYLKEKRWKEAVRLVIYGILLFFIPFLFFLGKDGFILWLSNILETFKVDCVGRVEFIKGVYCTCSYYLIGNVNETIGTSVAIFFLLVLLFLAFISNSLSRSVFFLCAIMTLLPSNAFRYTICYLSIPLIIDLMEHGNEKVTKPFPVLETVIYGLVFTIPTYWGVVTQFRLNFNDEYSRMTYVEVWVYGMAYLLLGIIIVHELIDVLKNNNYNSELKKLIKTKV